MKAERLLQYLDEQRRWVHALIEQLDEIQVAFNARYDEFKARHDATLARLGEQVAARPDALHPRLRAAIEERVEVERQRIHERRKRIRDEYLPARREAADDLLRKAQEQMATLRKLNPRLNEREEELKGAKARLEARLAALNAEIGEKSRGLGVVWHFLTITKADRERQRIIGRLEAINEELYKVRREWEREREQVEKKQAELQERWRLESVAVARLQAELDRLDDKASREALALRRAVRYVLDNLKEPMPGPDPELNAALEEMITLNIQTDEYHEGLAAVSGFIGLLRGIDGGLKAIRQSVHSLYREQQMHSAYLAPLYFILPGSVQAMSEQWPILAERFADEETVGRHPAEFAANIKPLLEGPFSEKQIETVFADLGRMIRRATARW